MVSATIKRVRLDEVCAMNMGQSPDSKSYNQDERGLPFYQGNADFGVLHPLPRYWCDSPTKVADKDDILISVRAPIGALNIADSKCCIGRGLAALRPKACCDLWYLYYYLKSRVNELNSKGTGSTFKAINKKNLADTPVPLPPLAEQKRIAAALDKISEMKRNAEARLQKLDLLVKARFNEMFGNCEKVVPLSLMGKISTGATPSMKVAEYYDNSDYCFVKPSDLAYDVVQFSDSESHISKRAETVARMYNPGAVLVTCIGATIGKLGIAKVRGTCNQQINIVEPNDAVDSVYLAYALQSRKDALVAAANSTAVPILNKSEFSKFKLPLPSLAIQRQFAAFVEKVEAQKAIAQKELEKVDLLYRAKLQEYFG